MNAKRDQNHIPTLLGVSNADGITPVNIFADPVTHRLLVDSANGSGTVTSVSVVTANGISGTVATATTTPAITLTLGDITPSKVNGNVITASTGTLTLGAGKTLAANGNTTLGLAGITMDNSGGIIFTASKVLTISDTASISGTNTGDNATNTTSNAYADAKVSDTAYSSGWDGVTTIAPSKNAVYDKIETLVTGPSSATDNAIARFDSTTGKLVQDSAIEVYDYDAGGNVTYIRASQKTGNGADVAIQGGQGNATGNGGGFIATGSNGGATSGNGGDIKFSPGVGTGGGTNGKIRFKGYNGLTYDAILNADNIASSDKTFTFPNASGTLAISATGTGGTGSAGAGKQYIALNIGGVVYKLLHDGTI